MARDRRLAREAWLLNKKAAPLKSCLAEDWEEDYAKSKYLATHREASSRPESELPCPAGLCVDDGKLFAFDRILVPKARINQVTQE